jgi:hypothetical protein
LRVELPSGHFAELRDHMLHGDVRFAKKAAKFRVSRGGDSDVDLSFEDEVTGAILYRMLIQWDVPQQLPRDAQNLDLALGILDMLEEDDFAALRKAVRPFYLKVMERPAEEESPKEESGLTAISSYAGPEPDGLPNPNTTDIST